MSHIMDDGVGGRLKTKLRTLVVRGFFAIWLNFFFLHVAKFILSLDEEDKICIYGRKNEFNTLNTFT